MLENLNAHHQFALRITEVFHSLQGESIKIGLPTVFIRLTGCPLRCQYCDTSYAFQGGKKITIENLLTQVNNFDCPDICITGGEPLAQANVHALMSALCDAGYRVSLETSGALDITPVDSRVMIVMDIKTPGSGEHEKNCYANLDQLKTGDQIKLVICSEHDYRWAKQFVLDHHGQHRAEILFSPSHDELEPSQLAEWILRDRLPVRFQLQLHKILWHNAQGR